MTFVPAVVGVTVVVIYSALAKHYRAYTNSGQPLRAAPTGEHAENQPQIASPTHGQPGPVLTRQGSFHAQASTAHVVTSPLDNLSVLAAGNLGSLLPAAKPQHRAHAPTVVVRHQQVAQSTLTPEQGAVGGFGDRLGEQLNSFAAASAQQAQQAQQAASEQAQQAQQAQLASQQANEQRQAFLQALENAEHRQQAQLLQAATAAKQRQQAEFLNAVATAKQNQQQEAFLQAAAANKQHQQEEFYQAVIANKQRQVAEFLRAVSASHATPPPPPPAPVHAPSSGTGTAPLDCSWALAYLRANAAPGFSFSCPGNALGHQAMTVETCVGNSCSGHISIAVVCAASVKNEAWNSRHPNGPIDPYGHC